FFLRSGDVRLSLRAINRELALRVYDALLAKSDGYFYFWGGETADWLEHVVRVQTLQSLTLDLWMEEFRKLCKRTGNECNQSRRGQMVQAPKAARRKPKPRPATKRSRRRQPGTDPLDLQPDCNSDS